MVLPRMVLREHDSVVKTAHGQTCSRCGLRMGGRVLLQKPAFVPTVKQLASSLKAR